MSDVTEPERGPLTLAQIHWLQGWVGGVVDHDPFAGRMLERALDELEAHRHEEGPDHQDGPWAEGWTRRVQAAGDSRPPDAPSWADRWEKDADGVCRWRGRAPSLGFSDPVAGANPSAPAYAYARDLAPNMKRVVIYLKERPNQ